MRILFICDLNSVHSQKWIKYFVEKKHEVFIYSTTMFHDEYLGAKVYCRKVETGAAASYPHKSASLSSKLSKVWPKLIENLFRFYRPLRILADIPAHVRRLKSLMNEINPEIVHCLRIPNEGFIGLLSGSGAALVISTWGNDLTYWARKPIFNALTRRTLSRCDFLFSDCEKDIKVSRTYGFSKDKPRLVIPGAGGMFPNDLADGRTALNSRSDFFSEFLKIETRPVILSLRGFGSQGQEVSNIPLLMACKLLARHGTVVKLVIAGRRDGFRYNKLANMIKDIGLEESVFLIDQLSHPDALKALHSADFCISVAKHDGTPNSMLEAMTFGAIPVMSDIESIREWITDEVNGYLLDPQKPKSIADTMQRAIAEKEKHDMMRKLNYDLIAEKADYMKNMSRAEKTLIDFLKKNGQ